MNLKQGFSMFFSLKIRHKPDLDKNYPQNKYDFEK